MSDVPERLSQALADRYRIERELGRGGMATVYLAQDLKHGRPVAVKVLLPELAAVLGGERFLQEIRVTANLQHPHILPLYDSGTAVGRSGGQADGSTDLPTDPSTDFLYYVMPYVEGESLRDRLRRETQLPIEDTLRLTDQVAAALDFAHRHDVIHRDIKPENILLHDGEAMVADFGIALAVNAAGGERLTETGLSLGTPEYMSPEQVAGEREIDARSDIYSLGCVVYEMLAGQPPFTGATGRAILARHVTDPVPPIKTVRPGLSDPAAAAVARALSKVPADRFPSTKSFAEALRAATRLAPTGTARPPEGTTAEPPPRLSVAVLPFQNMSPDPENEYFSDGITEELLNTLAKVPQLHVAARTSAFSFKGTSAPIAEIAAALRVAHVVEGSVRRVGNRVRITAQLISAVDGYHLWSESYDRDLGDIFALQREIAEAIGRALEIGLTRGWDRALSPDKSVVAEAYDRYLRGRFCVHRLTRDDLQRALDHFHGALEIDATLALAYSGLCKTYSMLADAYLSPREAAPKALAAAERALELDPTLAEAHADLGMVLAAFEWRWAESEAAFERALELNPNLPEAYIFRAWNCFALADRETALPLFERGFALDPLSAFASMMLGWGYVFTNRFDEAIRQWAITQELSPGMVYIDSQLGIALREKGDYGGALKAFEEVEPALGRPSTGKAITLARMGRVEEAWDLARELETAFERAYFLPEFLAEVFAALGNADRAIHWLERGLEERSAGVQRLRVPGFEPLYDDPRYLGILERVGLPPPPAAGSTERSGEPSADVATSRASSPELPAEADTSAPKIKSIVVLPFENLSPDPDQEYFSDGLTDEVIADLSKVHSLRVISRSSAMTFKGSDKRIPEIAQDLKVRYALEGSVRKAGNSLRITAQLIDAKHDVHLWADKYTGALEDVFDMQEKVSLAIVDALRVTLTADEVANLAERPLNDVSAFECYLRAKASSFEFSVEGVHRAIQHLDDGLRMIGANALLYSGLAFAYMQLVNIGSEHEESLAKAHQYVEQALALDPQCADAHATLAWIVMLEGDVVAMAKESKQALALDPTHTLALATLASAYIYAGRLAAAQPVCERLQQVDPIAFQTHWTLGALAFYGGEFDAAVQLWHALYDHYSSAAYAPFSYAIALYYSGEHDAAAAVFNENAVRHPGNAVTKVGLILKHASQRDTSGTHALMDPEFVKTCRRDYSFAHHVAGAFAVLGETEEALAWLETAIDGGFINYPMLVEYDPLLVSVRGNERFKKLMGRVKRKWEEFEV